MLPATNQRQHGQLNRDYSRLAAVLVAFIRVGTPEEYAETDTILSPGRRVLGSPLEQLVVMAVLTSAWPDPDHPPAGPRSASMSRQSPALPRRDPPALLYATPPRRSSRSALDHLVRPLTSYQRTSFRHALGLSLMIAFYYASRASPPSTTHELPRSARTSSLSGLRPCSRLCSQPVLPVRDRPLRPRRLYTAARFRLGLPRVSGSAYLMLVASLMGTGASADTRAIRTHPRERVDPEVAKVG